MTDQADLTNPPAATSELAPAPGYEHVAQIERHSVLAWPATVVEQWSDGWIMRATPGLLGRGRSNHALTPARPLDRREYDGALERVCEFASVNGIDCGVQVSPLEIHVPLLDELSGRGWNIQQAVVVMTGDTALVSDGFDPSFELFVSDHATPEWIGAWRHCDNRPDVDEHVRTVFPRMAGMARFAHAGNRACGISVELEGIVGLFCIAVSPDERRQGLGKKLVRGMLAGHSGSSLTYLQVFSENVAGLALYESLGFFEEYRYCHCVLPGSVPHDAAGTAAGAAITAGGAAAASGDGR